MSEECGQNTAMTHPLSVDNIPEVAGLREQCDLVGNVHVLCSAV